MTDRNFQASLADYMGSHTWHMAHAESAERAPGVPASTMAWALDMEG